MLYRIEHSIEIKKEPDSKQYVLKSSLISNNE